MSRIGLKPVAVPNGVEVAVDGRVVKVKGPKGELSQEVSGAIEVGVDQDKKEVRVTRGTENQEDRAKHGLYRQLISNMVEGVSKGYEKRLEIQGVGYRADIQGNVLQLNVGFNSQRPEYFKIPEAVKIDVPGPTEIVVTGIDKQKVGQVAASIRAVRPPDVYKGKGIRYKGEQVRKLPGKTVGAAGA